jgi:hypothetical protein
MISNKRKIVLIHPRKRGFATAQNDYSTVFDFSEIYGIKCFNCTDFFSKDLHKNLGKDDVLIVYINIVKDNNEILEKFKSLNCIKILRTYDAFNSDGLPYRSALDIAKRLEIDKFITSANLPKLNSALEESDIKYRHAYAHMLDFSNAITDFGTKHYHIGVSGHLSWETYTTRTRIFDYLSRFEKDKLSVSYLPHPGYEVANASHDIIGEKYIHFLSNSWLNVTCRGGWRDGLVCKYIEIGKALSLPICDIPHDMPEEMKEVVININFDDTNFELKQKIYGALEDNDLKDRILYYQDLCRNNFDYKVLVPKFIQCVESLCEE